MSGELEIEFDMRCPICNKWFKLPECACGYDDIEFNRISYIINIHEIDFSDLLRYIYIMSHKYEKRYDVGSLKSLREAILEVLKSEKGDQP